MSLGSELKKAREGRKITLEEISKKTKIPPKYLEAIEEGTFEVFSSHAYAKGFIRAYAKVVGLDPQVLTRRFNAEVTPEEVRIEPKNAEAELEKALGWRPTLDRPSVFRRQEEPAGLDLELVEEAEPSRHEAAFLRRMAASRRKVQWGKWATQGGMVLGALVLIVGLVLLGQKAVSGIHWPSSGPSVKAGARPAPGAWVQDKYQHLILKGLDKSWVLVTMDDGQTSSELDLDEGEVKAYKAERSFKLKIGNAGGVDVQFNGKSLGVLGILGQVVEIELPGGTVEAGNDNS
jgi:transcriptional regulator with XRE-family HTH domain